IHWVRTVSVTFDRLHMTIQLGSCEHVETISYGFINRGLFGAQGLNFSLLGLPCFLETLAFPHWTHQTTEHLHIEHMCVPHREQLTEGRDRDRERGKLTRWCKKQVQQINDRIESHFYGLQLRQKLQYICTSSQKVQSSG
ncbi:hypothetical protein RRG08_058330, partial [Elysia crispata]